MSDTGDEIDRHQHYRTVPVMLRRWVEWWTAWAIRRGLTEDEAVTALRKAFPWRDWAWREDILAGARRRNRA